MHYFIGSGISPFMHFGTKTINEVFGKPELSSPYLGFGENGNFVGGFLSLPKNNKLSASFFAGNHRDKELFNTDENNKGLVVEYQRSLSDLIISIQTGILTENSPVSPINATLCPITPSLNLTASAISLSAEAFLI